MQPIVGTIRAFYNSLVLDMQAPEITANDYREMALKAESEDKLEVAEECWRRAVAIAREEKVDSSLLNNTLDGMSSFYDRAHRFDLAIHASLESFALKQTVFGTNSTTVAAAADILASLYFRSGDVSNAARYGALCLEGLERNFGKLSEVSAIACLNLSTVEISRRNYLRATNYLKLALNARVSVYGKAHAKTAQVATILAEVFELINSDTSNGAASKSSRSIT